MCQLLLIVFIKRLVEWNDEIRVDLIPLSTDFFEELPTNLSWPPPPKIYTMTFPPSSIVTISKFSLIIFFFSNNLGSIFVLHDEWTEFGWCLVISNATRVFLRAIRFLETTKYDRITTIFNYTCFFFSQWKNTLLIKHLIALFTFIEITNNFFLKSRTRQIILNNQ